MNKIISSLVFFATLTLLPTANAMPKYNPYGVQNDVAVDHVMQGGWRILYQGLYRDGMPSVPALFRGACDQLMLASRRVGSPKFDILSTIETHIYLPLNTQRHTSIWSNGAEWYKNNQSMGFAGPGDVINQTSADTNGIGERDRLSWHTIRIFNEPNTKLNPGWRSGNNIKLDKSDQWERLILTTTEASSATQSTGKSSCLPLG